jgi:hypothetical protein
MAMREIGIGVARGDGLALFREPKAPVHGPRRLGLDGAPAGPPPRAAAAPSVEQRQGHAVLATHRAMSSCAR